MPKRKENPNAYGVATPTHFEPPNPNGYGSFTSLLGSNGDYDGGYGAAYSMPPKIYADYPDHIGASQHTVFYQQSPLPVSPHPNLENGCDPRTVASRHASPMSNNNLSSQACDTTFQQHTEPGWYSRPASNMRGENTIVSQHQVLPQGEQFMAQLNAGYATPQDQGNPAPPAELTERITITTERIPTTPKEVLEMMVLMVYNFFLFKQLAKPKLNAIVQKLLICPFAKANSYSLWPECWVGFGQKSRLVNHLKECHSDPRPKCWPTLDFGSSHQNQVISAMTLVQHEQVKKINRRLPQLEHWKQVYTIIYGEGTPIPSTDDDADVVEYMNHLLHFLDDFGRQQLQPSYAKLSPDLKGSLRGPEVLYQAIFRLWLPEAFRGHEAQKVKGFAMDLDRRNSALKLDFNNEE